MKTYFLVIWLLTCSAKTLTADEPPYVSLVQLIANPKDFDGKVVQVCGVVRLEFEDKAIYLHSDDLKYSLTKNGLWLDTPSTQKQKFNGKYVLLEGTFNAASKGHRDLWSGSLERISRIRLLRETEENYKP